MFSIRRRARVSRPEGPSPGSLRDLILAWMSAVLVLVAIPVGRAASTAFLASRGYGPYETEPPGLGLLAFVQLALIVLVPVSTATWFGLRASRGGRRSGVTAAVLALALGGALVLLGLPVFLSRLLGWPGVLACGAIVAAVVLAVAKSRDRRQPPHRSPPHRTA